MIAFRSLSIRRKLVVMIMIVTGTVLLVSSFGYLLTDTIRARTNAAADASTQALVLAESAAAALSFNDEPGSREVLETLRNDPKVRAACLYRMDGTLFMDYLSEGSAPCPPAPPDEPMVQRGARMYHTVPAAFRGEQSGVLHVRSDLTFLQRRMREQAVIVAALLVFALGVGLLLSAGLQSIVSSPITSLARTASEISSRGDFSLRATRTTEDELGDLVDRFNEMVARIQQREADLSEANEELRREVAERKRAEQERAALLVREREANRLKDEFLATLSHELRTPLNAILGWTKLLRSHAVPAADADRALEKVERNAQVQARLVEDLLEVSRIASGKLRLEFKDVDLVPLVHTALETIRPTAEARGVLLEREIHVISLPTSGDAVRLQQVVWNLLSNAVKFTPHGGRVRVQLGRTDDVDELTVTDTGAGIDPEFLPHVFDAFRQADASSTRAHGGLGLGLSIVRQLVEMHGGSVAADSEGRDRGARFTVRLPVRRTTRVTKPAPPAWGPAGRQLEGRTIVVVDDDEDTREMLKTLLERAGARVVVAASAGEGLGACLEHQPDVLVTDIAMPGEDGYRLMDHLRTALGLDAPRVNVAVTAFASEPDRTRSSAAGFQAHVAKPFEPGALVELITNLLET